MLGKKLLTLACVLGILACGACFGPIIEHLPIVRALANARSIQVVVTNVSPTRHVDPSLFADALVEALNQPYQEGIEPASISATDAVQGTTADAILKVILLKESARPLHDLFQPPGFWKNSVTLSATLTSRDGRVHWSSGEITLSAESQGSLDQDNPLATRLWRNQIADDLQETMLYINRP